jgi:hypothetical protein
VELEQLAIVHSQKPPLIAQQFLQESMAEGVGNAEGIVVAYISAND